MELHPSLVNRFCSSESHAAVTLAIQDTASFLSNLLILEKSFFNACFVWWIWFCSCCSSVSSSRRSLEEDSLRKFKAFERLGSWAAFAVVARFLCSTTTFKQVDIILPYQLTNSNTMKQIHEIIELLQLPKKKKKLHGYDRTHRNNFILSVFSGFFFVFWLSQSTKWTEKWDQIV